MSETSIVKELSDAEILGLKWSDLTCYGLYWENNSEKPILIIRIQPQNAPLQELVCDWAANLKSVMKFRNNHGGPLMTWEVVFSKQADDRWKVVFEFLDDGYIDFDCNSLGLREL